MLTQAKIPMSMFWFPFTYTFCHTSQAGWAQKEANELWSLEGSGTSRERSQFVLNKGIDSRWDCERSKVVSDMCPDADLKGREYILLTHASQGLQREEVSSLGRLILEDFRNWTNTGLRRNVCSGCGWQYRLLHLSFMWGSQALLTTVHITLCSFQSAVVHFLTQNWLSEMLMGKSCWND